MKETKRAANNMPHEDPEHQERLLMVETGIDPAVWREQGHPPPSLLVASREDVLPQPLAERVTSHIELCPSCTRLLEDLLDPDVACPTLGEITRIRRRLPMPSPPQRPWKTLALIALTLVTAALSIVAVRTLSSGPISPQFVAPMPPGPPAPPGLVFRIPVEPAPLKLPPASTLAWRSQDGGPDQAYLVELGQALKPYREGRYREAAVRLQSLASQYPQSVEAPFYAGVSHLLAGDALFALEWLTKKPLVRSHPLYDDQLWYRAAALEQTGQWAEARDLLRQLCKLSGGYQQKACQLSKR
ncbi:MAG: hypothetical protein NZV14_01520 [Bryobacteraceae bacterium]|nr:hypothetical protein [Bryobacteraceae bacterium]MDW8376809.1 hypothetical protein [Bryobacterales bacterium]